MVEVKYLKFRVEIIRDGKCLFEAGKVYPIRDELGYIEKWVRRGAVIVTKEEHDRQAKSKSPKPVVEPPKPIHPAVDDKKAVEAQIESQHPEEVVVEKAPSKEQDGKKSSEVANKKNK